MSHYTVLVVGDDAETQLAPFNEQDEKYCTFQDEEDEYFKEYNTKTTEVVKLASGEIVSKYKDRFWTKPKDFMSRSEFVLPKGASVIEEYPVNKLYSTFEEFMTEYHGMKRHKTHKRYGSVRNPKAKWDWYQLGGRWTGFLKLKNRSNEGSMLTDKHIAALATQYGTTKEVVETLAALVKKGDFNALSDYNRKHPVRGGYELEKTLQELQATQYTNAKVGSPGLGAGLPEAGWVDSAKVEDIDFEGMREHAGYEARKRFEKAETLLGGSIPKLTIQWADQLKRVKAKEITIDQARDEYHNQPAKKLVHNASQKCIDRDDRSFLTWLELEEYNCTIEEYVQRAKNRALSTFAILMNGEWYEKGEMGWFGMAHNEMSEDEWLKKFNELLMSLPNDTLISVYDCHI